MTPPIIVPTVAQNPAHVADVWSRGRELDNWHLHLHQIRNDERQDNPAWVHEAARGAYDLANSLVKYVAVPHAIALTCADVFALCLMISDPEVAA